MLSFASSHNIHGSMHKSRQAYENTPYGDKPALELWKGWEAPLRGRYVLSSISEI